MRPVFKGNKKSYKFTFTVGTPAVPLNITGMTVLFTVKAKKTDAYDDALIKKVVTTHSNPTAGETVVELFGTDTTIAPGNYLAYWTLLDSTGEPVTIKEEPFTIVPSEK